MSSFTRRKILAIATGLLLALGLVIYAWAYGTLYQEAEELRQELEGLRAKKADLERLVANRETELGQLTSRLDATGLSLEERSTELARVEDKISTVGQYMSDLGIDERRIDAIIGYLSPSQDDGDKNFEIDRFSPTTLARIQDSIRDGRVTVDNARWLVKDLFPKDALLRVVVVPVFLRAAENGEDENSRTAVLKEVLGYLDEAEAQVLTTTKARAAVRGNRASVLLELARVDQSSADSARIMDDFDYASEHAGGEMRNHWYRRSIEAFQALSGGLSAKVVEFACDENRVGTSVVRNNICAQLNMDMAHVLRDEPERASVFACAGAKRFRIDAEYETEAELEAIKSRYQDSCDFHQKRGKARK